MSDVDDTIWSVTDARRPRRANRALLLPELLEKGLDESEEDLLQNLSDASTDSTFTASDEETEDEVDSDFSDEEIEGVLEGEEVETEEMLQRQERQEKQRERQKALRKMEHNVTRNNNNNNNKGGGLGNGKGIIVRLRPKATIPLEERLEAAHKRAREVRAAAANIIGEERGNDEFGHFSGGGAAQYNVGVSMKKRRRFNNNNNNQRARMGAGGSYLDVEREEEVEQRVRYTSGKSVLEQFGVPVIISFSQCLPRMFQS